MRVQSKIILLQFIVVGLFLILGFFLYFSQQKQIALFVESNNIEKSTVLNAISAMKKESMNNYVNDYSTWDDMVNFVKNKDKDWAKLYINNSLALFKYDIAWILDNEENEIYFTSTFFKDPIQIPIPKQKIAEYFKKNKYGNFFFFYENNLIEISASSIRPTNDIYKKSSAQGYYFVGKLWQQEEITNIEHLTGYNIQVEKAGTYKPITTSTSSDIIKSSEDLLGWDGSKIGYIILSSQNKYFKEIKITSLYLVIAIIIVAFFIILLSHFLLKIWVTKPIQKIITSLNFNDTSLIEEMAKHKTEFGMLSTLVLNNETQKNELIIARNEADSANKAKSLFLANMSHEIRTPMNGIMGMTELALNTDLDEHQREFLNIVKSSSNSLLKILNDILEYSKIEAGKLELQKQPFEIRETLNEVFDLFSVTAKQKGLYITLNTEENIPMVIIGDSLKLKQVLSNLLGNGIKFTSQGGIIIDVKHEEMYENKVKLKFTVSDTGIGIADDKLDRLFKRFSQVDDSYSKNFGGTGLGLAISKNLVEIMGGEIGVKSKLGYGSSFFFTAIFETDNKKYNT